MVNDEKESDLLAAWQVEERVPFIGWDFSHLRGRWHEENPPWSYDGLARSLLRQARAALDLGTGGGERLASMADAFPERVVATEGYRPNVLVAQRRLNPLGVEVVEAAAGASLPFADGSFDLVIDRHTFFDAGEVARVLIAGGMFLTQQIDGRSLADLIGHFGAQVPYPEVTRAALVDDLRRAGLEINDVQEHSLHTRFDDVGAIVYYLHAVPWTVPNFSITRYRSELLELQLRLEANQPLAFKAQRFLIRATKPNR